MLNLLDECVKLAEPPVVSSVEEIDGKIAHYEKTRKELFGFESDAIAAVDDKLSALRGLKKVTAKSKSVYRRFVSLDMLTWRDHEGLPRIALFGLNSPVFQMVARNTSSFDITYSSRVEQPNLPDKLREPYREALRGLWKQCGDAPWKYERVTAECAYTGVIPPETRVKIKEAIQVFGDKNVFIMAEAKNWTLNKERAPFMADPLVVGWDGHHLWLVDKFDLTPIEKMLATEFTE